MSMTKESGSMSQTMGIPPARIIASSVAGKVKLLNRTCFPLTPIEIKQATNAIVLFDARYPQNFESTISARVLDALVCNSAELLNIPFR